MPARRQIHRAAIENARVSRSHAPGERRAMAHAGYRASARSSTASMRDSSQMSRTAPAMAAAGAGGTQCARRHTKAEVAAHSRPQKASYAHRSLLLCSAVPQTCASGMHHPVRATSQRVGGIDRSGFKWPLRAFFRPICARYTKTLCSLCPTADFCLANVLEKMPTGAGDRLGIRAKGRRVRTHARCVDAWQSDPRSERSTMRRAL